VTKKEAPAFLPALFNHALSSLAGTENQRQ
jgi:hypothetical protein